LAKSPRPTASPAPDAPSARARKPRRARRKSATSPRNAARITQLEHDLKDAAERLTALASENESLAARRDELQKLAEHDGWTIAGLRSRLREFEAKSEVFSDHIRQLNAALADLAIDRGLRAENDRFQRINIIAEDHRHRDEAEARLYGHARAMTAKAEPPVTDGARQ
jgi:small-conductance mechanosensitive channel